MPRAACSVEDFAPLPLAGLRLLPGLNTHVHLAFDGTAEARAGWLAEPLGALRDVAFVMVAGRPAVVDGARVGGLAA